MPYCAEVHNSREVLASNDDARHLLHEQANGMVHGYEDCAQTQLAVEGHRQSIEGSLAAALLEFGAVVKGDGLCIFTDADKTKTHRRFLGEGFPHQIDHAAAKGQEDHYVHDQGVDDNEGEELRRDRQQHPRPREDHAQRLKEACHDEGQGVDEVPGVLDDSLIRVVYEPLVELEAIVGLAGPDVGPQQLVGQIPPPFQGEASSEKYRKPSIGMVSRETAQMILMLL